MSEHRDSFSGICPTCGQSFLVEKVEQLERSLSEAVNRQVPTPAAVVDVITEYDAIVAGIPADALERDGDEADFVMRVADYRTLRGAICTAQREEQPK